ncbi:MAG: hypothetical protein NTX61_16770 [Bacteroidetes bacterium]|nr:hypothetical protein [Bacteroidota bacterium]
MKTLAWLITVTFCIIYTAQGQDAPVYEKNMKADSMRRQTGYFNYTQFGIGVRLNNPVLALSTVNGYQFSRSVSLGLGVGYSYVNYPLWNDRYLWSLKMYKSEYTLAFDQLNLFIEPRFFIGRKDPVFLFIDLGYSLFVSPNTHDLNQAEISDYLRNFPDKRYDTLVKTKHSGTFYIAPGAGMKLFLAKNISLNFSLQLFVAGCNVEESLVTYGTIHPHNALKMNLYPLFSVGIGF